MKRFRIQPLGVDIGSARARIAVSEAARDGEVRLRAVAARDMPGDGADPCILGALLEEMIAELSVRERRCVAALGAPVATMRVMRFPKMTWAERLQAAKFEAARFIPNSEQAGTKVRVHPFGRDETFSVGTVKRAALDALLEKLRSARLRPIAVDHDAFAFKRVLPDVDAVLDLGERRGTLHVIGTMPLSFAIEAGGKDVSRAIAQHLAIDEASAERRKRILGAAGTSPEIRSGLTSSAANAIEKARMRTPIGRVALVGNASRLPGLAEDLEEMSGATVELPVAGLLRTSAYPADVLRAAAPDWTLAAALTTWPIAG